MENGFRADSTVRDAFDHASALLRAGDANTAESVCRDALERFPADGNLLSLLAASLVRQRRPVEAEDALRSVVDRFPEFAKAQEELGNALLAQQRLEEAAACLRRAIELEPQNGPAYYKLARALTALGREGEAQEAYKQSLSIAPTDDALARATELSNAGRFDAAERIYQEMLARDPENAELMQRMGDLAMRQGQSGDAVVLLRHAVQLAPDMVTAWINLGKALGDSDEVGDAIEALQHAIRLEPRALLPHLMIAGYWTRMARYDEVISAYRAGLDIRPGNADCLLGLGHALRTIGRHSDAVRTYRDLIGQHPEFGEAYWSLANLKNVPFEPREVQAMHEQLSNEDLSGESRIHFWFALGKAYEDQSEYEKSFEFYQRGNSARRQLETYDPVETQLAADHIIGVFDAQFIENSAAAGPQDPAPIFIVGLPRSGTTLIEQILASHRQVEGIRELPDLERIIERIDRCSAPGVRYPEALKSLHPGDFAEFGTQYLESTQRYRTGEKFFIDKMPNNFHHIGFINMILPNAKVIDARRHPLDSCLGSYKQLFVKGQSYSYDLFELGEYYLQYARLMDHWHRVLPGRVCVVHYEDMVYDQGNQTRRLLEHCGLPWQDACLDFHETERAIESASSEQVRQPIYSSSVNSWRHYEAQLGELIEILQPVLKDLPEDQRPRQDS